MDVVTEVHYWIEELKEVKEYFEGKYTGDVITDIQLRDIYKNSKQLSDLCWQEIQRRRRDGS